MKMLRAMFVLCIALMSTSANCEIRISDSMNEIYEIFKDTQGETLGIFDIDMVLKQPIEPAFQMPNITKYKVIFKELLAPLTPIERNLALNLVIKKDSSILVEANAPHIITEIQKITPKLIALTASLTGKLGSILDMNLQRYQSLKEVGIDFSNSFPEFQALIFNDFKPFRNNYPEFNKGVLSANGEHEDIDKGQVLVAFLKRVNYLTNSIIFVDDREKNVKDMEAALSLCNPKIQFIGIVYKGAENFPSQSINESKFKKAWLQKINAAKNMMDRVSEKQTVN